MMRKFLFLIITAVSISGELRSQKLFPGPVYPLRVIFDTDFGPDYDDVGAITLLHAYADSGRLQILATIASSRHKNVAAALNVFNTYFNRPDIPIGIVGGKAVELGDKQHWTDSVTRHFPHRIKNNAEAYDAITLYRKILTAQPDHSITVITVGFFTNLANLLRSPPDSISPLSGYELVGRKVISLVSMAGRFPTGYEFNLDQDIPSAQKVFADWPTLILLSGFEIGMKIKTGLPLIHNENIKHSPVKEVFALCIPFSAEDSAGRMSWDETAVFVAVNGWKEHYDLQLGRCIIHDTGLDEWKDGSRQFRLLEKTPPEQMSRIINEAIMHQPVTALPY